MARNHTFLVRYSTGEFRLLKTAAKNDGITKNIAAYVREKSLIQGKFISMKTLALLNHLVRTRDTERASRLIAEEMSLRRKSK